MNFFYIFIFIFKFIKNSKHKSNIIHCIRKKYGECGLRQFRQMERISKKLVKAQCDVEFVRMCLIYDLQPKFVRFKLSNKNLASSLKIKKFQRQLLLSEYLEKQKRVKKLKTEIDMMIKGSFLNTFDLYYRTKLKTHLRTMKKYETERIKAPPHPNFYFRSRAFDLPEIFRKVVFWAKHITVKISAKNMKPFKTYLRFTDQNGGVGVSQIPLLSEVLGSSGLFH